MNSNAKGKRFERSVAALIRSFGWEARRGQQYQGTPDSPDVQADMPLTIECKHRQAWAVYDWLQKLLSERKHGTLPVIFAKKNHCDPLVIIPADDFLEFCQFTDLDGYERYKRLEDVRL